MTELFPVHFGKHRGDMLGVLFFAIPYFPAPPSPLHAACSRLSVCFVLRLVVSFSRRWRTAP